MSGTILRRRDRTARPPRVEHYSSAVNILKGARCVVGMSAPAAKPGMQDAYVEHTLERRWVGRNQIVCHVSLPETLTMQGHIQCLNLERFRSSSAEDLYVVR